MGISTALQAGVSGLRTQGMKLATISDNIANSNTIGYKRRDVQFANLVTGQGSGNTYTAGGTTGRVRTDIAAEGGQIASDSATDFAVGGPGFFVVGSESEPGPSGNRFALTRAGSFSPDENGNLRNASGYFLQGFPLSPDGSYTNGTPFLDGFGSVETVNIGNLSFTGAPTTQISFTGNLPAQQTGQATPPSPLITSMEYFDELGGAGRITAEWQPGAVANEWTLSLYNGADTTAPVLVSDTVTFSGGGANAGTPLAYGAGLGVTADGTIALPVSATQTIDFFVGAVGTYGGVSQFDGDYTPATTRDGARSGQLSTVEMQDDGTLIALFDNGGQRPVWQIPLADVENPNGMAAQDGSAFRPDTDSGAVRLHRAGEGPTGSIIAGALENADVDIATELTDLIQTQRTFSSNATIVRTADEMLEEAIRIKR